MLHGGGLRKYFHWTWASVMVFRPRSGFSPWLQQLVLEVFGGLRVQPLPSGQG